MLTGTELGAAIEAARLKKGITKKDLAAAFGVTPPSVQDWVKRGTIDKDRLVSLWQFFADVVGPEHWGLPWRFPGTSHEAHEPSPAYRVAPALPDALGVVLSRLQLLDDYTAGKVLGALHAATKPNAPLEQIEADLHIWLTPTSATAQSPKRRPSG